MPPVNSAPSSEPDNEATAELPVLDVAAYEATLDASNEKTEHTDTWAVPAGSIDGTSEMPALKADSIPTLVPAYDLDHSGTHEMPALLKRNHAGAVSRPNQPATAATSAPPVKRVTAEASASPPPAIELPRSPPLIEELRGALARAESRIEQLNERARIADAERSVAIARANAECAQLREQLVAQLEALSTVKERLGVRGTDQTELEDAYFARGDRIGELEKQLAAQARTLDDTRAQLAASVHRGEMLQADVVNLRAGIERRNTQIARLEADLAARQQRETMLAGRLTDALSSADPNVRELRADLMLRDEKLRELKAEVEAARVRAAEKDSDLEVAEESIRNLENELRTKTSKLEEACLTVEEWRAVIAESQRSILQRDNRIQQLEAENARRAAPAVAAEPAGEDAALEGPARVLIRTDGNTDFVHVLGRRTRIGRGPDNELVLDTKHVSRYHAVLLAGPAHTSLEDLNSTNGTFVNGKRITRQVLKDGDRVTIGRTQFRYTVRD
jgi:predicted  nucleic acid-binding Zn-ribbon protein